MTRLKRFGFIALVGALVLSSCGGSDDDSGGDSAIGQAISAELMADGDTPFTQEEADCAGQKIVSEVGEDRLIELGVSEEDAGDIQDYDFSDDEIENIGSAVFGCVDNFIARALTASGDFSDEDAECLGNELDSDIEELFVQSAFTDDEMPDEIVTALFAAFAECGVTP
ncbi:MAG: hypothetical protein GY929_07660 [Actinomycetia bacterium]|nr:hypothetical protein [Actinomycetes bacterium]